jgi:hypothetical protein
MRSSRNILIALFCGNRAIKKFEFENINHKQIYEKKNKKKR